MFYRRNSWRNSNRNANSKTNLSCLTCLRIKPKIQVFLLQYHQITRAQYRIFGLLWKQFTKWNSRCLIILLLWRNTDKYTSNLFSGWVCRTYTVLNHLDIVFLLTLYLKQLDLKLSFLLWSLSRYCLANPSKFTLTPNKKYSLQISNMKLYINHLHRKLVLPLDMAVGFQITIKEALLDSIKDHRLLTSRNNETDRERNQ